MLTFKVYAGAMFMGILHSYNGTHTFFKFNRMLVESNTINQFKSLRMERV